MQMTDFKRREAAGMSPVARRRWWRVAGVALLALTVVLAIVGWYWSREPALEAPAQARSDVTGLALTDAAIHVARTLLDKPGGYLSNDVTPPSVLLDNMPNWEFGALVQLRDLARVLRNDLAGLQVNHVQAQAMSAIGNADPALIEERMEIEHG